MRRIRVGSRGSRLALVQTEAIVVALRKKLPGVAVSIEILETRGDRLQDVPLSRLGGSGVFVKEIEAALVEGRIDLAVHSMKDLASCLPEGLAIAATTERVDPRDALVAKSASSLESLPEGATVATGSLRRRSQLLSFRPDLHIVDLRGNVPTRLEKLDRSDWHAVVLAGAGLGRLGLSDRIRAYISVSTMIPAVGQGALALQARSDDRELLERVGFLNHPESARAIRAERSFLARLEGGCQVPIAAFSDEREALRLRGYVGTVDGDKHVKRELEGDPRAPEELGLALAETMLAEGGEEILRELGARR